MATIVRDDLATAGLLIEQDPGHAAAIATEIVDREPDNLPALRLLARALRGMDRPALADTLDLRMIAIAARRPALATAIRHFAAGRLHAAEKVVRRSLAADPDDVAAICLLAEIARLAGVFDEAEKLLRRALALAPGFTEARVNLAKLRFQQNDPGGALDLIDHVLDAAPDDAGALAAKLGILVQNGNYRRAMACYESALIRHGRDARLWNDYAHVLRTVGRMEESMRAFRAALAIDPGLGESWLGLADIPGASLDAADIVAMEAAIADAGDDDARRVPLHFALGKTLETHARYEPSFRHYAAGNRLRRHALPYDADVTTDEVRRGIAFFTAERLRAFAGSGADSTAPIFVVGMPRAGSTLVEQILASHPLVEGLSERPDLPRLVMRMLADRRQRAGAAFPEILAELSRDALRSLGQSYLQAVAACRKTRRPFFVDKLPNNWAYIGFIQLILPNAKVIDIRRDPVACCFSNFAQHFARGQGFSNDLRDVGRCYRDYVSLVEHFDTLLPGRVTHVGYEALIDAPDAEIRTLLRSIDLPFDPSCLRFHENRRPVPTTSAAQVRQPINRNGIDRSQPYLPWLDELKGP